MTLDFMTTVSPCCQTMRSVTAVASCFCFPAFFLRVHHPDTGQHRKFTRRPPPPASAAVPSTPGVIPNVVIENFLERVFGRWFVFSSRDPTECIGSQAQLVTCCGRRALNYDTMEDKGSTV